LLDVPENPALRASLSRKTLEELTEILASYKKMHNSTDTDTKKRAIRAIEIADYQAKQQAEELTFDPIDSLIIGIDIDRELRRQNISSRLKKRLDEGLIDEVKQLLQSGVTVEDLLYYGLEYKFVTLYVIDSLSYDEMFAQLETAIHQFAKRQMTWFRGMERRGFTIHWIDAALPLDEKVGKCLELWSVYVKSKKIG
jgi:tRNA dimethylallyltransferase